MKSWRIGAYRQTEFRIHPACLICYLYAALTGHLLFIAVATGSILIHEAAHVLAAMLFKRPLLCIELTPLGAMLRTGDADELPWWKRLMVILAGPIASWALCVLVVWIGKNHAASTAWCRMLFCSNLSILMMNLLPAYPLDGGRVLAMCLERCLSRRLVAHMMRIIGMVLGFTLILLNVYCSWKLGGWNLSLALAGCCMIHSARMETTTWAMLELQSFLDRRIMLERRGRMPARVNYVLSKVPLTELVHTLPPSHMMYYVCLEPGSMNLIGTCTESEIIQHYLSTPSMTVGEAVKMSQNCSASSKMDTK